MLQQKEMNGRFPLIYHILLQFNYHGEQAEEGEHGLEEEKGEEAANGLTMESLRELSATTSENTGESRSLRRQLCGATDDCSGLSGFLPFLKFLDRPPLGRRPAR